MSQIKYKDFDAMFAEMKGDKVAFKVFGKMYEIDKTMPAMLVLELARNEKSKALTTEFMFRSARQIFGDDILDEIVAHKGFTVAHLERLIKWAFDAINGEGEPTDAVVEVTEDDVDVDKKPKN